MVEPSMDELGRIFYKFQPQDFEGLGDIVDDTTHTLYIAKNRLHRWWLRKRHPEVAKDIVLMKMLKSTYKLNIDLRTSVPKEKE